jgi:ring-1,2-phenylacetyl-CoA epoxidase subunit PaaD
MENIVLSTDISKVWEILELVHDPEVPVLTVLDLGIIRDVRKENGKMVVDITPTYTGCPAMDVIEMSIRSMLEDHGFRDIIVNQVLSPAWTTDWISENGKNKLREYGIAPPLRSTGDKHALFSEERKIACPQCSSHNTELISQFGSTACKALYRCLDCKEPFDYFKCH